MQQNIRIVNYKGKQFLVTFVHDDNLTIDTVQELKTKTTKNPDVRHFIARQTEIARGDAGLGIEKFGVVDTRFSHTKNLS